MYVCMYVCDSFVNMYVGAPAASLANAATTQLAVAKLVGGNSHLMYGTPEVRSAGGKNTANPYPRSY